MFQGAKTLHIGTSSWSCKDWVGNFYPSNLKPAQFIEHYGTVYDTVEIDATYYRMPTNRMVTAWKNRTPKAFRFAVKTPKVITHEKKLVDAKYDMKQFLNIIGGLGERLGPILMQFPYFNKKAFSTMEPFVKQLDSFLEVIPDEFQVAIEIRNKNWLKQPLFDVCREHQICLAWTEHSWMPSAKEWSSQVGECFADFAYFRWLGDRKGIEKITTTWNSLVIDRTSVMKDWIEVVRKFTNKNIQVFGYFNNHFAGYAPESIELFRKLWI